MLAASPAEPPAFADHEAGASDGDVTTGSSRRHPRPIASALYLSTYISARFRPHPRGAAAKRGLFS